MNEFKTISIAEQQDLFAEELRSARLDKKISINKVSTETGINKQYILAMEKGDFYSLPAGIYGKKFIKEYALFLGIYNKQNPIFKANPDDRKKSNKNDPFYRQALKKIYFLTIPKLIKGLIILFLAIACIFYLGYYLDKITASPYLQVTSPSQDSTTTKNFIILRGKTDPEAEININNEPILKNSDGSFAKNLFLKSGVNTISISAQKKYSRQKTIIRKIIVEQKINID